MFGTDTEATNTNYLSVLNYVSLTPARNHFTACTVEPLYKTMNIYTVLRGVLCKRNGWHEFSLSPRRTSPA